MTYTTILTGREGPVGIVTLNRPEKMNALNATLFDEMGKAVNAFEEDPDIKAIVVTAAGEKAFSAGMDIRVITQQSPEEHDQWVARIIEYNWNLATCAKPTIAAVNGLAYGGGAMIASLCDFRVGCERSKFSYLGVTYARINSTWTLPLIVGWVVAKDLLLTGRVVEAEEAFRINLLNRLVPSSELMKTAVGMGQTIAGNNPNAVKAIKKMLIADVGKSWREMYQEEIDTMKVLEKPSAGDSFKGFLERKNSR